MPPTLISYLYFILLSAQLTPLLWLGLNVTFTWKPFLAPSPDQALLLQVLLPLGHFLLILSMSVEWFEWWLTACPSYQAESSVRAGICLLCSHCISTAWYNVAHSRSTCSICRKNKYFQVLAGLLLDSYDSFSIGTKTLSSFLILCVQFISRLLISLQIKRTEDMKQTICDYIKNRSVLHPPFHLGKVTFQTF